MREDIGSIVDGTFIIDWEKVIGKGYTRGLFFNCNARYRLFKGARNTKKSKDIIGYEPIMKILSNDKRNILVLRQNDVDNRQSTYENIVGCLDDLGISVGTKSDQMASFITSTQPLMITYRPTGQKIIFRGLNNPTSLNGITFSHGYLTDVYIDEAFEIESYSDFRKLDGSLRGKLPNGLSLQMTLCFNSWAKSTWLYTDFFKDRLEDDKNVLDDPNRTFMDYYNPNFIGPYGKGLYLHTSTYKINEFRDKEVYDASAMEMKAKSPSTYEVEFLGMWGNSTSQVYKGFTDKLIVPIQKIFETDERMMPKIDFIDFRIGIDTGLSNGEGKKRVVLKNENVDEKIKSATAMSLVAITSDYGKMYIIDEYFHSNVGSYSGYNTDNNQNMTEPELVTKCITTIRDWIEKYSNKTYLLRGSINVFVDSADIGFRQNLELKAREYGLYQLSFYGSTKMPVQSRVDFYSLMMDYGDLIVTDKCKNYIREVKNARRGEKGEARQDGDDHMLTAVEYGFQQMLPDLRQFKTFKVH